MITNDWTIAALLEEYPQTLDVLIEASPHFKKLNNQFLRKTFAPRVSIGQAATIGKVDVDTLLAKLNTITGNAQPEQCHCEENKLAMASEDPSRTPPAIANLASPDEILLDVRPIIHSGVDPFKAIIRAVKEMRPDQVLHLINSFEPVPLYTVLGERGLEHWANRIDDTWHIFFYVNASQPAADNGKQISSRSLPAADSPHIVELDVRGLEPPEPMVRILDRLSQIDESSILLVHHHREPVMLYGKLEQRGYCAAAHRIDENYVKVIITKKPER